jgi:WD40 repeat protein
LCPSPDGLHLAVGYEDGSIRIFSLLSGEGNVTFNGHKAAITTLKYDQLGGRLASGSKVRVGYQDFGQAYAEASLHKSLGKTLAFQCSK